MFQVSRLVVGGLLGRRSLQPLAAAAFAPPLDNGQFLAAVGGVRHGSRHGGNKDFRKDFNILKDYPVGPHKLLPPNVKYDGRIGPVKNYRHIIHYPEKYTIRALPVTKLGGRDPETMRKVIGKVGGGSKQKARWIDWRRWPQHLDPDGPDHLERVIFVRYDPMRKAMIALTGSGAHLRWQVATSNMKAGDLITTTCKIPANPVKPVAGNGYPLGALPVGTDVCLIQWLPDGDEVRVFNAEESAKLVRKVGDRVIIQKAQTKLQFSLDKRCMCVVGSVSIHPLKKIPIGTPNRSRWMGNAPASGLWHRKSGIHGRKIRAPPPVKEIHEPEPEKDQKIVLHCKTEGIPGAPPCRKRPFDVNLW